MKSTIGLKTRAHEWLADRVPGIQYPHIRPLRVPARQPRRVFATKMDPATRVFLALSGMAVVVVSALFLATFLFVLWALLFG